MRSIFFLVTFLFFGSAFAQNVTLTGTVLFEKRSLENVNVLNSSTSEFTVTNSGGEFTIIVNLGDAVQIQYLGMETIQRVVNQQDLEKAKMIITMNMASSTLQEVRINTIDAVSLGIIPKRVKPLTSNERKFIGESEINSVNLTGLFGLGIGLVPLINAINGRTKELKNNIKIEKKEALLIHLKLKHSDYLMTKLKLTEEESLTQFYYFLVDIKNIENEVYNQNTAQVNFYLFNKYMEFQELLK